jgi:uncharacterized protein (DUF1800 family)
MIHIKHLLRYVLLIAVIQQILFAGSIKKETWIPVSVENIITFVPYMMILPDKDGDGIEDSLDRPIAYPVDVVADVNENDVSVILKGRDNDNALRFILVSSPEHGVLKGTAPHLYYTPDVNYKGEDYFTYRVSDGDHLSDIVTVRLHVGTQATYHVASEKEASAFLSRATYGPTYEEIEDLVIRNDYEKWIDEQFAKKPSYHMDWIHSHAKGVNDIPDLNKSREDWKRYSDALAAMQRDAWWDIVVNGEDQLRQRVAFALSEILVISRNGPLLAFPDARVSYYDLLVKNAFGNFEDLLRDVTYHPAMGKYLSYLGNAKSENGSHPDENYAREVMQLFTIGLYQLNLDGSKKLQNGKTLPTYNQNDIQQMAKVFTGLTDQNGFFFASDGGSSFVSRTEPMIAVEEYHDKTEKRILLGQEVIPSGGDTKTDINRALHILFMHPNTGPFIARQLIQRLVTSNPSPEYVARVATVFNDNGTGVRGDLKAVVKAILLDDEALHGSANYPDIFGKFREPLLFVSNLFRAFHAQNGEHILTQGELELYKYRSFNFNGTGFTRQEGALESLTVFNYFTPEDAPYLLKQQGLVAPELELYGKSGIDDQLMGLITKNGFVYQLFNITAELQLETEIALVHEKKYDALLERLDILLCAGHLSEATKASIKSFMERTHGKKISGYVVDDERLVRYTIGLVMTSPDYALQR